MTKIRLDQLMVNRKLVKSRTKAQAMIIAGQIFVEEKMISKSGTMFKDDARIKIKNLHSEWVSRGAYKILHIIKKFNIEVKNKICLDLGASTGGFTEVLLKQGAKKIYSVDVGRNQLHEKLIKEKKIINFEKTNARYLNDSIIIDKIDIITCDVSFISMKKVIKPCLKFLNNNGIVIALIKPQFEAMKKEIKKGVVINENVQSRICKDFQTWYQKDCLMEVIGITESPLKGPKGNKEFLIYSKNYKNLKQ